MTIRTLYVILGSLALAAGSPHPVTAGGPTRVPVESAEGKDVEVRYANGSTVLMVILQDKIEIATPFGKLAIPPADIRQIEFGVHLTEATEKRIETLLGQLTSDIYRQREAALKELVALGPQAYLALHRALKGKDEEVIKRAQMAIKHITQKVPPRLLRLQEDDKIRTTKFTVVGRIVTPAIKARAEYFGDLNLQPSQLLAMRMLESPGETEVTVDAAKYGSAADRWMDSGIHVEAQMGMKIVAAGQVDLWPQQPGQYMTGPGGMGNGGGGLVLGPGRVVRQQNSGGTLMGRIGEDGEPFLIGERNVHTPNRQGRLYLHIVPSPWGNPSSGSYRVRVITGPSAGEGED